MVKVVGGQRYLSATEAAQVLGISIARFYTNARKYLRVYRFDAKKVKWYSESQVLAMKEGKPVRKASIAITGMFSNWTKHARSLGFNVESQVIEKGDVETLPQDLQETFSLSTDEKFVRRTQMSFVDGTPICIWSTWYLIALVGKVLPQIKDGSLRDVEGYLAEQGFPVCNVSDVYSGRITTFEEQARFQLLNDEPLLVLQRMAKTKDEQIAVLYQDMELLSSWFVIKRSETVDHWSK